MKEKIKYENLSGWLKALVIMAWIFVGLFGMSFVFAFIKGFMSTI